MSNPYKSKKSFETVAETDGKKYICETDDKHSRIIQEEKKENSPVSDFFRTLSKWIFGKETSK